MKKVSVSAIILAVITMASIGAAAYVFSVSRRAPTAPAGPAEKIVIANIGPFSVYNIIAKEKGFFRQNGLDAQVDEYDSGASSMAALLSGKADIAVAAEFVGVINSFEHRDLRILAGVSRHEVFRLIARRDKGISSPANLGGKRIGVTKKTHGEFYLNRFLRFNGIDIDGVEKEDLGPAAMTEQLKDGRLDAAIIFEPRAYAVEKELGNAVIAWSAQRDLDAYALVYSTQLMTERRPEVIERYLRSIVMADRYLKEHEAEARALLAEALGYDASYDSYIWPKFDFFVALRQETLLRMEEQARFLVADGPVPRPVPDYLDLIYFSGLEKIDPSAVSITH